MGEKEKIGIMTLHRALNFGAVWQCYALKRACESLGHKVETIDYNPYGHYTIYGSLHHRPLVAYRYLLFMHQFDQFVKTRLNPTTHTESHEWILDNPPHDDVYIVGSDTVWSNAVVGDYLDSYLLDFAPAHVKRVSYAASTGGNPMVLNDYQLRELNKFNAISIRERQSVQDVQKLTNIPVSDVCDPTLLLSQEEYEKVEKRPFCLPKHYIVYFDLAGDSFCAETTKKLSKELNLPILNLAGKFKHWARYFRLAPTPEQWLYIMHHADFVCTNSFHGVCFSIIFNRPFVCCAVQTGGRAKTNGRVQNLLERTHFTNRYITDIVQLSSELIRESTDFIENARYVETYRNRSLEWLKNAIEDETNEK